MRTYLYCAFLLTLLVGTNFFCSNSPFDSYTNLGSDVLNDQDSLLTVFDGKIYKGFLGILNAEHFLDTTDSIRSGLNIVSPTPIGAWRNERSFAYYKFKANIIKDSLALITKNRKNTFLSFTVNFTNDAEKSDPADNACVEFGYYFDNTSPDAISTKSDTALIDTSKFREIGNFSYNGNVSSSHTIPLNKNYFVKDTTVSDTSTVLYVYEKIDTVEWSMVPESTFIDTITTLYVLGKDTLVLDTIKGLTDTTFAIGFIHFSLKMVNPPELLGDILVKDTTVYDTISSSNALLKENQIILYSNTDDSINTVDTITVIWDTVVTAPETTTVYQINSKSITITNGNNTTNVIQYDTVHILTTIIQDSIFQTATISPKNSFIYDATHAVWDSVNDTALSLYARLDSVKSNTLQFIKDFHLKLTYVRDSNNTVDTVSVVFLPFYYDFSVIEADTAAINNKLISSGGAGRYTRLELDMTPFKDSLLDVNDSTILYHNVPKAALTLYLDSVARHVSIGNKIFTRYILSPVKTNNVEDIIYTTSGTETVPLYKFSPAIEDTPEYIEIKLNTFLIDIIKAENSMPETLYLYLWLSHGYFSQITWGNTLELPFDFIVSGSQ